jgi:hypothetical protein
MTAIPIVTHDHAVPVLLTQAARETARAFAAQQADPGQAQRVYRNTLAVCTVHTYLKLLGIETDLAWGDSWHAVIRSSSDSADLFVAGRGRLECRPVETGAAVLDIPDEVQLRRIAYLAIEMAEQPTEAQILGFICPTEVETAAQLRPMEEFLDYLWTVHQTDLRQWLEHCFDETWQEPKVVLVKAASAFRLRGEVRPPIRRAKRIELRSHPKPLALGLLISLRSQDTSIQVSAQLHGVSQDSPDVETKTDTTLPPGVALTLLNDTAEHLQNVTARAEFPDNFIQLLPFTCEPGEQYSIQISFKDQSYTEVLIA